MTRLLATTWTRIDRSEGTRMALLSATSFLLAVVFLALLIADEANAAF